MLKKLPKDMSFLQYILKLRDPTTAAVLMEDGAACTGVLIAGTGIAVSQYTHMIIWDNIAGLSVAGMMGFMGLYLARLNQRFLLGQSVDPEIVSDISAIIQARASVEGMHSVQSQWIGPNSFAYKAEVEIDGTYLAARLLSRYQKEFVTYIINRNHTHTHTAGKTLGQGLGQGDPGVGAGVVGEESGAVDEDEIRLLLSWYAEDVMRLVEQEVKEIESAIRRKYPEAVYIEIEPDSSLGESGEAAASYVDVSVDDYIKAGKRGRVRAADSVGGEDGAGVVLETPRIQRYAIDDGRQKASLRRLEIDTINQMQAQLHVDAAAANK